MSKPSLLMLIRASFLMAFSVSKFNSLPGGYVPSDGNEDAATKSNRSFWRAAWMTMTVAALVVAVGFASGKLDTRLALDNGKALSLVGGFIAGWATLFQLGDFHDSNDGNTLAEHARNFIFKATFLIGLLVAAVGQLWWQ